MAQFNARHQFLPALYRDVGLECKAQQFSALKTCSVCVSVQLLPPPPPPPPPPPQERYDVSTGSQECNQEGLHPMPSVS